MCVYVYICVTESLAVHLKLTQRKSTLLQLKKKKTFHAKATNMQQNDGFY